MRKLNVYDVVSVTSVHERLLELDYAEKILQQDFEAADRDWPKKCHIVADVTSILQKRKNALDIYRKELMEELKHAQVGLLDFGEVVHFQDMNVEKAVKKELNISNRQVTKSDMHQLKSLSIEGAFSLEGLQYADAIEDLSLTWSDIFTDQESDTESAIIFSIIRPTLKRFFVSHSVIKKYTSLSVLHNLEYLHLEANYGEQFDFATFGLLTKVEKLVVSNNCLSIPIKKHLAIHPELLDLIEVI
ncbi:MAG: hypothetical protein KBT36_10160 [Kurthia sp.]|nr:hypothetical protein [Candidatus Kurthia equi]